MTAELKINKEYSELVPPLSTEEYESLKESIKENGLRHPIDINKEGVVLDGHHRYRACKELGIKPITVTKDFPDKLSETLHVIDSNLTRRQLNNYQKTKLALKLKPILEQIAKMNMSVGGKNKSKGKDNDKGVGLLVALSMTVVGMVK
jgi:ParB-like nuclease domain